MRQRKTVCQATPVCARIFASKPLSPRCSLLHSPRQALARRAGKGPRPTLARADELTKVATGSPHSQPTTLHPPRPSLAPVPRFAIYRRRLVAGLPLDLGSPRHDACCRAEGFRAAGLPHSHALCQAAPCVVGHLPASLPPYLSTTLPPCFPASLPRNSLACCNAIRSLPGKPGTARRPECGRS